MNKKKSLTVALADTPAETPAQTSARPAPGPVSAARPGRAAKTNVTGYFDKPVKWELQELVNRR